MKKCLKIFCESDFEKFFEIFINFKTKSDQRSINSNQEKMTKKTEYNKFVSFFEQRKFVFFYVVCMLRNKSIFCRKFLPKIFVIFRQLVADDMTYLNNFFVDHDVFSLQSTYNERYDENQRKFEKQQNQLFFKIRCLLIKRIGDDKCKIIHFHWITKFKNLCLN